MICRESVLLALAATLVASATSAQVVIEVPGDQPTIQAGINEAVTGDIVEISPGTYFENLIIETPGITIRSAGDDPLMTIVDAGDSGTVLSIVAAENTVIRGLTLANGMAATASGVRIQLSNGVRLENCRIAENDATGTGDGGGVYVVSSEAVEIIDTVVTNNFAARHGGGLFGVLSSVIVDNSEISFNIAGGQGGGMYLDASGSPLISLISRSQLRMNSATGDGGGIYLTEGGITVNETTLSMNTTSTGDGGGLHLLPSLASAIEESRIAGNTAPLGHGGGAYVDGSMQGVDVEFCSTSITDNGAGANGGGLYLRRLALPSSPAAIVGTLEGCTFSNNSAGSSGGGTYILDSRVTSNNTVFWSDSAPEGAEATVSGFGLGNAILDVDFSDLDQTLVTVLGFGDLLYGPQNINADPLFVDPLAGDYHLAAGSPCIDVGFAGVATCPEDFERDTRVIDGDQNGFAEPDMGADERCFFLAGDVNQSGAVDIADPSYLLAYLFKSGRAPQPVVEVGDVNGDASVNLADAVALLNFLFANGDPPICRP